LIGPRALSSSRPPARPLQASSRPQSYMLSTPSACWANPRASPLSAGRASLQRQDTAKSLLLVKLSKHPQAPGVLYSSSTPKFSLNRFLYKTL
jgi:hypothetical protein